MLQSMMSDSLVSAAYRICVVVTLVDTVHGELTLEEHAEARNQVALADRLLLTKSDLRPLSDQLSAELEALNPGAPRMMVADVVASVLFEETSIEHLSDRLAGLGRPPRHDGIEAFTVVRDRPLPALALTLLLQAIAEHCGGRLLRLKGLVAIEEMPGQPAVIHGVRHVFSPPDFLERWPTADRRTRIVVITRQVPRYFVARLLDAIEAEVREATSGALSTFRPVPRVACPKTGETMERRGFLAGAAATALAQPSLAGRSKTLTMIPQVALNSIDPVWTSSQIARNLGFMVFDLLYGRDEAMNARPQMVEADLVEDGTKRWTLRLRENLWWHDGDKVLARDCVRLAASLDEAQSGRRRFGGPAGRARGD